VPNKKTYTLIVVPDDNSPVSRYRIPKSLRVQVGVAALLVCGLLGGASVHYLQVARDAAENRILRDENLSLRGQLKTVRERVDHIGSTLDRVERFDQKLRAITLMSEADRGLAIGPTSSPPEARVPEAQVSHLARTAASQAPRALSSRLDKLAATAGRQEQSLQELTDYFQDQRSLLASTPSIWPARGWVTSDFGQRLDPYTADRMMHAGMDIAAEPGKPIYAPSNAIVGFAGSEGSYGNVIVLDHGYGIKTRYGHLGEMLVKAGDRVKRGAQLGSVGNTGRSTGPHLHYEVRVNGIPQNPRKFVLDD
jgi:murein DD-endopeptidase MepM/ murein hydrolase activator NlpD